MKAKLLKELRKEYEFFYLEKADKFVVFKKDTKESVESDTIPELLHVMSDEFFDDMSMRRYHLLRSLKYRRNANYALRSNCNYYLSIVGKLERELLTGNTITIKTL